MKYSVSLRKRATGVIRVIPQDLDWGEASDYWWTAGNMSCDCNRRMLFEGAEEAERIQTERETAAMAIGPDEGWKDCGDDEYDLVQITFEDGSILKAKPSNDPGTRERLTDSAGVVVYG